MALSHTGVLPQLEGYPRSKETIVDRETGGRILLIDVARFYGLVLVYYGHIIERVMNLGDPTATYHYKFIYSFHMPLFFLLSGYISKRPDLPFARFLRNLFASRLIPLIFFNLLLVILSLLFAGDFFLVDLTSLKGYLWGLIRTATGLPVFNIPTWFFFMLFSVEVLHFFVYPHIKTPKRLLISAVCFYLGGWLLNWKIQFFHADRILWNFWYIHEAVVVYSFYLLGLFLSQWKILEEKRSLWVVLPALLLSLAIVYLTYNLNKGPFRFYDAVIIAASGHGNIVLFPLTTIIGSLFILLLAKT